MRQFPTEIGILVYPGSQAAAVLGMTDLLTYAERQTRLQTDGKMPSLRITHWQKEPNDGIPTCIFDTSPGKENAPSVLVIPPGLGELASKETASEYSKWLHALHAQGTCLASVCKGAFLLAETGLLTGRTATTHWAYEEEFRLRFPKVVVDTDRLIIDDGDLITAGGAMSWIDLTLRLVDRFLGPSIMINTARAFVIDPPGREQRNYSAFSPRLDHGDLAILRVQHWLQAHDGKEMSLAALSAQAGLERRTFIRRFQKATGLTTGDYIQRLRVGKARELLQFGKLPVEKIAWEVGYNDPSAFRKVFGKITGLSPGDYRQRFGVKGAEQAPYKISGRPTPY
ncbi:GlxA family transcriptional regulator [Rhizobium sp. NZLR1]|uniref:GlxA family transcriptional regulator n=1 Tax=Rhizobium sp. NZLR1 TaxID=2731096 RepID=UPI001A995A91|nr:GlxA family transcriptional regulator [Rhizobium sp. NZLR1]MBX5201653.1 GlxA family transcriptional regulator [Rhizobium sp. NZLR1]QSZ24315.1 GlxA family transcriptional regulator [Rhizobium sp. NZLR1]